LKLTIDNFAAVDRLIDRFRNLINPDAEPLMLSWMIIIEKDNQKGVLAGLDKHGNTLQPVTYRPVKPGGIKLTKDQKLGAKGNARGKFAGFGPAASGLHNNLTSAEYRQLGGPPLAPRGRYSRVITNLQTEFRRDSATRWEAFGYWREVVSVKGEKFLHYHFHGIGKTKQRDLTGVRPEGVEKARAAGRAWLHDMVRSGGA
jgi:hypothetical protein